MQTLLIALIALFSVAICVFAGFWFYRTAGERRQNTTPPQVAHRHNRNVAWDHAVRSARNRNR
jgi:hypothetical protein